MTNSFEHVREAFLNALMEHPLYQELTTTLHNKYKDQMVDDDYPEEYWDEFDTKYDQLVLDLPSSRLK